MAPVTKLDRPQTEGRVRKCGSNLWRCIVLLLPLAAQADQLISHLNGILRSPNLMVAVVVQMNGHSSSCVCQRRRTTSGRTSTIAVGSESEPRNMIQNKEQGLVVAPDHRETMHVN
jgi:hypothetical protein